MAALHPKFLPSSFCSNQISIGSISPASNPLRNGAFSRKNSSSVAYTPLCLRSKLANPSMADSFHSIEHVLHSLIPGPKIQNPKPTSFASNSPNLNWNPLQKLAALALDKIEKDFIPKLEGQTLPSTADPRVQLEGNFAPVSEMSVHHKLEIEGTLPACLEGLYLRNGANPRFEPTAGHHFFDGDGMLHAVQFKDGVASYCCRYTQTHRLMEEEKIGRAIFPKAIGELHGHGGAARLMVFCARNLFGLVDGSKGMGPANAGVIFFDRHVLAMSEDDQPYAVKVLENGDLQTLGRYDFNGQLGASMIAHPKKDPKTGELFALSYDVVKKPYLKYFYFSKEGVKGPDVEITLNEPTMMHDFAITENYAVIPDQQLVFRLEKMLKGGSPVERDAGKTSRFGVLPKYAKDEKDLKWIDVPDCFCFHVWNAWEENEEEIVVLGSCMTPADCVFNESQEEMNSILCEIRLNLKTGTSTRNKIAGLNLEAGQVNRQYLGRKARFLYLAVAGPWPKICGIAKIDMEKGGEDRVVCTKIHGDGCYGGEPFFVPRSTDPSAAEDDGYVLSFVHNEKTGESKLVVLDAKSPDLAMVASIKLPGRVPYGFHGTFVTPDELMNQKQSL